MDSNQTVTKHIIIRPPLPIDVICEIKESASEENLFEILTDHERTPDPCICYKPTYELSAQVS